jgi:hypothetical protein
MISGLELLVVVQVEEALSRRPGKEETVAEALVIEVAAAADGLRRRYTRLPLEESPCLMPR